jgi:hypothetical protein
MNGAFTVGSTRLAYGQKDGKPYWGCIFLGGAH